MGYQIIYGRTSFKKRIYKKRSKPFKRITICFMALLILTGIGWIGWSNRTIRQWFIPGNPLVTEQAFSELISDIRDGKTLSDAIITFCNEIISNA